MILKLDFKEKKMKYLKRILTTVISAGFITIALHPTPLLAACKDPVDPCFGLSYTSKGGTLTLLYSDASRIGCDSNCYSKLKPNNNVTIWSYIKRNTTPMPSAKYAFTWTNNGEGGDKTSGSFDLMISVEDATDYPSYTKLGFNIKNLKGKGDNLACSIAGKHWYNDQVIDNNQNPVIALACGDLDTLTK